MCAPGWSPPRPPICLRRSTRPPPLPGAAGASVPRPLGGGRGGCMGPVPPFPPAVAHEIVACSIGAATRVPRFPPVRRDERAAREYGVDILEGLEPAGG